MLKICAVSGFSCMHSNAQFSSEWYKTDNSYFESSLLRIWVISSHWLLRKVSEKIDDSLWIICQFWIMKTFSSSRYLGFWEKLSKTKRNNWKIMITRFLRCSNIMFHAQKRSKTVKSFSFLRPRIKEMVKKSQNIIADRSGSYLGLVGSIFRLTSEVFLERNFSLLPFWPMKAHL